MSVPTDLLHDIGLAGAASALEYLDDLLPEDPAAREAAAQLLYEIVVGAIEAFILQANMLQRVGISNEN